jgi:hypothetical protein
MTSSAVGRGLAGRQPAGRGGSASTVWLSAVPAPNGTCCDLVQGPKVPHWVASAAFEDGVNTTGWGVLHVETSAAWPSSVQGYAAGLLEGYLTSESIYSAFLNFISVFYGTNPPGRTDSPSTRTKPNQCVLNFVHAQWEWMQASAASCMSNCTYWEHVNVTMRQAEGLFDGYSRSDAPSLDWDEVYQLTNAGDLEDLFRAFPDSQCPSEKSAVLPPAVRRGMHCSGFVRAVAEPKNVLTGHVTFNDYEFMLRVYKVYSMSVSGSVARVTSFSSRPGDLHSKDDFYMLDSGMTVIETSLTVFNEHLYKQLVPSTVPCWIRVNVANRLAQSPQQWTQWFSQYHSGTHNNDWIVTLSDTAGSWRLEEMPGTVVAWDVTPALASDGFLFSVNIPNSSVIFDLSGYNATGFNLLTDPRARIFRSRGVSAVDMDTLQTLMVHNDYQRDPLSDGDPCNAISARCDLPGVNGSGHRPYAFGGIDAKLTDSSWMQQGRVWAQSGPTDDGVPVFQFSPDWNSISHWGMPDRWAFSFIVIDSSGPEP